MKDKRPYLVAVDASRIFGNRHEAEKAERRVARFFAHYDGELELRPALEPRKSAKGYWWDRVWVARKGASPWYYCRPCNVGRFERRTIGMKICSWDALIDSTKQPIDPLFDDLARQQSKGQEDAN